MKVSIPKMKTFYTILVSVLISLFVIAGTIVYIINYVPFGALDLFTFNPSADGPVSFGTTLTDLNSTDTMSNFPTLYNANNLAINRGKIEVSTTTLPLLTTLLNLTSVGTITTGIWRGTGIEVGYGGTGTTSPTSNLVILGNGSAGFKTVSGFGTTGQFLTSTGAASAPTWQSASVDQNAVYTWTALHTFNGNMIIGSNATSTGFLTLASTTIARLITVTPYELVRAYPSGNVTVTKGGADVKIAFDTESYDLASEFNTSTNTFTASSNGYYSVSASSFVDGTGPTSQMYMILYKNGIGVATTTSARETSTLPGQKVQLSLNDTIQLTAGDTLNLYASSTVNCFLTGGSGWTWVNIFKMK